MLGRVVHTVTTVWYIQLQPCFKWFNGYIILLRIRNNSVKVVQYNNLTVTACVFRLSAVTLKRCVLLTKGMHTACLQMFMYETCGLEGAIY